jgi:hypothetical protein
VDEDAAEAGLVAAGAERGQFGRVVVGEPPRPGALDEELQGVGADLGRAVDRLLDPARAVGSEDHEENLASS